MSNRQNERIRRRVPADLVAYATALRPLATTLRTLAEDATSAPSKRVYSRLHLRNGMLRAIRELEVRIDAVTSAAPVEPQDGGAA